MLANYQSEETNQSLQKFPLEFEKGQVFTPKFLANWVAQLLAKKIISDNSITILDPACGDGELLVAANKIVQNANLIGVDIDPLAIKRAKERLSDNGEFYLADMLEVKDFEKNRLSTFQNNIDAIIANPPWGADIKYSTSQLQSAGFKLANGQYDIWCLFVELSLNKLKKNGSAVFILPDAIFLPEHASTRRLIAENNTIELIARLGEGLFKDVCRGTVVVLIKKTPPAPNHKVEAFRLLRDERKKVTTGELTLEALRHSNSHRISQNRFVQDRYSRWDIDIKSSEYKSIEKMENLGGDWVSLLEAGRGVEISKKGAIRCCPKCSFALPAPTKPRQVACRQCGIISRSDDMPLRHIIASDPFKNDEFIPFIAGEDVKRYEVNSKRHLKLGVNGLNYKNMDVYSKERLLVRKTGVGLNATITNELAASNQVVFHFLLKAKIAHWDFYLPYVLGVLSSRIMFAYHLRKSGESEWRSHPYITPTILKTFPIPIPKEGTQSWAQAQAIADAVRSHLKAETKDLESDLHIECLVAGLFKLSKKDITWVKMVISTAQNLEPMRALQNFDTTSVVATRVS